MSSVRIRAVAGLFTAVLVSSAGSAQAATFGAAELSYDAALLSQFNLVNLGNFTATGSQTIAGRALVGGNMTTSATETICATATCGNTAMGVTSNPTAGVVNATSTSSNSTSSPANYGYGALTVFGNITGAATVTKGGDINVKGNVGASTYTLNQAGGFNYGGTSQTGTVVSGPTEVRRTSAGSGGSLTIPAPGFTSSEKTDTLAQVFAPFGSTASVANNFTAPMKALYSGLANLPGTPGVTAQTLPTNATGVFTSAVDYTNVVNGTTYKYGVVTTTLAALAAEKSTFTGIANGAGNSATFVIVSGDGAGAILPTLTNNDANVIYDFVDAYTLQLGGNFNASILAPLANLISGTGTVNGTVIVASMNQNAALFNGNAFTGVLTGLTNLSYNSRVPEPASLTLLGAGVAALAAFRRRRKTPVI